MPRSLEEQGIGAGYPVCLPALSCFHWRKKSNGSFHHAVPGVRYCTQVDVAGDMFVELKPGSLKN
jgi:hypothetical protein